MNQLQYRIIEISKQLSLSHLGSCLTAVDIIDRIYMQKKDDEPFVLSCGHAALALYVVLEKYEEKDALSLCIKHGTHPNRNLDDGIYCSTGSLGWGLPIAAGMALADRSKNVYCLISDGESFEGTIWETANLIRRYSISNLILHMNWNGYAAYHPVSRDHVERVKRIFPQIRIWETDVKDFGFAGQEAHYVKL